MAPAPAQKPNEAPSTPILAGIPDPEAALREIQNAEVVQTDPTVPHPMASEEYVFVVDHTDGSGVRRVGEFKNKILSIGQRLNVSLLQARLARNTP